MFNALRSVAVAASLTALAGAAVAGPVAVDFEGLKSAVASADPNGAVIGTLQAGGYSMAFENFLAFDDTLDSVTLPYKRETIATRSVFARNVIDSRPEDGTDNLIATIRLSGSGRTFSTLSFNYGLGQVGLNVYVTGSKGSSGAMNVVTNDCFKWNTDDNSANANCPGDDKPAASFDLSAYGEIESIAFAWPRAAATSPSTTCSWCRPAPTRVAAAPSPSPPAWR